MLALALARLRDEGTLVAVGETAGRTAGLDVYPDLPSVLLPREHLVQVLLNLVLNAADACGPGGHIAVRSVPGRTRFEIVLPNHAVAELQDYNMAGREGTT